MELVGAARDGGAQHASTIASDVVAGGVTPAAAGGGGAVDPSRPVDFPLPSAGTQITFPEPAAAAQLFLTRECGLVPVSASSPLPQPAAVVSKVEQPLPLLQPSSVTPEAAQPTAPLHLSAVAPEASELPLPLQLANFVHEAGVPPVISQPAVVVPSAAAPVPPKTLALAAQAPVDLQQPSAENSDHLHKNRLQQFAQRSSLPLPSYGIQNEGTDHAPQFRASVNVGGQLFVSSQTFPRRKDAEQDVAKMAYERLMTKVKEEGFPQIQQIFMLCKSILHEYAAKTNLEAPTYLTTKIDGLQPTFVGRVSINGITCQGQATATKKTAEHAAAQAAICSIIASSPENSTMTEIIYSKFILLSKRNAAAPNNVSCALPTGAQSTPATHAFSPQSGNKTELYDPTAPTSGIPPVGLSQGAPQFHSPQPIASFASYYQGGLQFQQPGTCAAPEQQIGAVAGPSVAVSQCSKKRKKKSKGGPAEKKLEISMEG